MDGEQNAGMNQCIDTLAPRIYAPIAPVRTGHFLQDGLFIPTRIVDRLT